MPRTRKAGRKGGEGVLSKIMGKTQKTKDKEQRINQAWEQSGEDQKVWEERRVVIEKAAAEAKAKAAAEAKAKAAAEAKAKAAVEAKAKAAAEAKEKAILDARIKAAIIRLSEIESLWKWNTDLARKLSLRSVGFQTPELSQGLTGAAHTEAKDKDMFAPADKKLNSIQAKKAALIKSLESNNTTTNPRGGRTKKRRFRHNKKGRKSRTHKRR